MFCHGRYITKHSRQPAATRCDGAAPPPGAQRACAPPDDHAGHAEHGGNDAHEGDQDAPRQAKDAPRMQGGLRLHEDVGGGAPPRLALAQHAAVVIVIEGGRADAAGAVVVARLEEADAVHADLGRINHAVGRLAPATPARLGTGGANNLGIRQARLDRVLAILRHDGVERRRSDLRDGFQQRVKHFAVQVERKRGEGEDQQQAPGPQAEGAVQIEIEPGAAGAPAYQEGCRLLALPPGGGAVIRLRQQGTGAVALDQARFLAQLVLLNLEQGKCAVQATAQVFALDSCFVALALTGSSRLPEKSLRFCGWKMSV